MNFKDVEALSAYLDGQMSPSDLSRLESRLASDPGLASTLQALRESRGILRRLPKRRAPRNFTLTPVMVGKKPPLPRSYPIFRFATALATLLFVFSYATNQVSQLAAPAPPAAYGIGGGAPESRPQSGGGGGDMEEPAATEPPMAAMAPLATEVPAESGYALIEPTATSEVAADASRAAEDSTAAKEPAYTVPAPQPAPMSVWSILMIVFAVIALLGAGAMFLLRRIAANKWRSK